MIILFLFLLITDLILLFKPDKVIIKERLKPNQTVDMMKKKIRVLASIILAFLILAISLFFYILSISITDEPQLYKSHKYVNIK